MNNNKNDLKIQILADPRSWIVPCVKKLKDKISLKGYNAKFITSKEKIEKGDILIIVGWERILSKNYLRLNKYNLVVHESDLPKGKGWSPLTWQILEGKNKVTITLFEADEKVDDGLIYFQDVMVFRGDELVDELRKKQCQKTIELVLKFLNSYPNITGEKQKGKETFYKKREPIDSKIEANKPIAEIFNNFRVADNKRYPVFFEYKGCKYILKIYKDKKNEKEDKSKN